MPEPTLMRKLFNCTDKESIMCEVGKLSEEEAKVALNMVLILWRRDIKTNKEIDSNRRKRIEELEEQLAAQNNK